MSEVSSRRSLVGRQLVRLSISSSRHALAATHLISIERNVKMMARIKNDARMLLGVAIYH